MLTRAIVVNFIIGCALIALGLIPGLLAALKEGMENFRGQFSRFPIAPRHPRRDEDSQLLPGQIWVAVGGIVLLLISLLAFLTR
jgi:hypothetical protein